MFYLQSLSLSIFYQKRLHFIEKRNKFRKNAYVLCLLYHSRILTKEILKNLSLVGEGVNNRPGFFAKIYLKRALTF